jgi:hypothetical protein
VREHLGHPGAELGGLVSRVGMLGDDAVDDAVPQQVRGADSL